MMISGQQFEREFDVTNDKLLDMIVDVIKENKIDNLEMLSIAGNVVKHVE